MITVLPLDLNNLKRYGYRLTKSDSHSHKQIVDIEVSFVDDRDYSGISISQYFGSEPFFAEICLKVSKSLPPDKLGKMCKFDLDDLMITDSFSQYTPQPYTFREYSNV